MACGGNVRCAREICGILAARTATSRAANGARPRRRDQAGGAHRRRYGRASVRRRRAHIRSRRQSWRFRTILNVPMLRENELVGCFAIYRQEVAAVQRQASGVGPELRSAGGDRHENTRLLASCAANRCSSRPQPPTCSRLSAARHSICIRFSTRLSTPPLGFAMRSRVRSLGSKMEYLFSGDYGFSQPFNEL